MKKTSITLVFSLFGIVSTTFSQIPEPGKLFSGKVLIQYATVHVGNGEVINNANVEIQNGEISRVVDASKSRVDQSEFDTLINANGAHLYPGFILMDSRLGLTEIGAVKATNDFDETGDYLPNVRAISAYNTESKIIPTVRSNGVLMAQIAPIGGRISGSSSLVHFDAWNWEEAVIKTDDGIYMNWPSRYRHTGWWGEPGVVKPNKNYEKEVASIYDFFQDAEAYSASNIGSTKNLRLEAMKDVFAGSTRLYIRAESAKDILDLVQFIRAFSLKKTALVGGGEAELVITELKENNIPVIIDRVHQLPKHIDSPVHEPFELAGILSKEKIPFAFSTSGDMEAMISRNLPFQAGTAVHHGLPYEEAIKALTLTPSIIMGCDNEYGTIEPGKRATLFISTGDALDITGNNLILAMVEGKFIDLKNHQIMLYERFTKRLEETRP
jgi:imidazolonepropionase-like amidohydrolase